MRLFSAVLILAILPSIGAAEHDEKSRSKRHEEVRRAPRCTLRVQAPEDSASRRPRVEPFSARESKDLRFDVWLRESQSSMPAEVRIYAPGGNLYKVLRVGPAEASITEGSRRRFSRRGLTVLSARLPLVGTHITSRSLYGEWRAEAYFVGAEGGCARPVDFVLEP